MIREKPHRLKKELYTGYKAAAFTLRVQGYHCPFVSNEIFGAMEAMLLEASSFYHADLPVYVFMPDHAHFILSGNDTEGDVLSAVKRFKQRSSYWLVRNHPVARWQKDFYDHILRPICDATYAPRA